MPELKAKPHDYSLTALLRFDREQLDVPTGSEDYLITEAAENITSEAGVQLTTVGSAITTLTYKLRGQAHDHTFTAKAKMTTEVIGIPADYYLVQEDGDNVLQENGDDLILTSGVQVTGYKLTAKAHDYSLKAVSRFPESPVLVTIEGTMLQEDGDKLLLEDGDELLYSERA